LAPKFTRKRDLNYDSYKYYGITAIQNTEVRNQKTERGTPNGERGTIFEDEHDDEDEHN